MLINCLPLLPHANVLIMSDDTSRIPRHRLHRSWRSVLPQLIFAFIGAGLVAYVSAYYNVFALEIPNLHLKLPLFLLVLGVLSIRPLFLMYDCRHLVGQHHLYSTFGLMSWRRNSTEIPFEDIVGVRVYQTIFQRILGVGDIGVWTATGDRPEVTMKGIFRPDKAMKLIRERVDQAIMERGLTMRNRRHSSPES